MTLEISKPEIIRFENKAAWLELRAQDLTSTDIATLFGCNPYSTFFELWHIKNNKQIVTIEENERMKFGNILEEIIAKEVCKTLGVEGSPLKSYYRIADLRLGSSFDWYIPEQEALLEIKNVDGLVHYKSWGKDNEGNEVAPLHIELQLQHQMLITGMKKGYIGALIGGNTLKILPRERNEKVIEEIVKKSQEFWASIDSKQEPEPNFETDYDFLFKLFNYAEPGKVLEIDGKGEIYSLAVRFNEAKKDEKATKTSLGALKAEMLTLIRDHEKVKHDEFSISASTNKKGVRLFRLTWKD